MNCEPLLGLPEPKRVFGFQPGPAFLSAREAELGYGFALVGRKSDAPSMRGVKGRDEPEAGLPGPKCGLGFQAGPDVLLGRAPPARGLPLLVEKGRDCPPFHPPDEDLSVGTPAFHPTDEDLSVGTPGLLRNGFAASGRAKPGRL